MRYGLVGFFGLLSLIGYGVLAHSNGPPPPADPRTTRMVEHVEPLRWSWLHWWEANRELHLAPLVQGRRMQDRQTAGALREQSVQALLGALADPSADVRSAAALALGRMKAEPAAAELQRVVRRDAGARSAALAAIGMLGDAAGQKFILDTQYGDDRTFIAAIVGLGAAEIALPATKDGLAAITRNRVPLACASLAALRQHAQRPGGRADFEVGRAAGRALQRTSSPWVASDSLLALGRAGGDEAMGALTSIAINDGLTSRLPAWQLLRDVKQRKAVHIMAAQGGPGESAHLGLELQWNRDHERLMEQAPWPVTRVDRAAGGVVLRKMVGGVEDIYMARLRSSAVLALGAGEGGAIAATLRRVLNESDDQYGYNRLPKCFAAIALGELGAPVGLQDLMDIVDAPRARAAQQVQYTESPLRGFAAIALGLYARPQQTEQGRVDRPGYQRAIDLLGARLTDPRETMELRSACAVALGLTRRTEILKDMIGFAGTLTGNDVPLVGYVLLARAMLGDRNLVRPVSNLLALPPAQDELTSTLTRRAGVLALGLQGGNDVIPLLTKAWHEPYFINREVVLALALCDAEGVCRAVIPRLKTSNNHFERAYMATVLGWLFTALPSPTAHVLAGTNFTMRDESMRPHRNGLNEFLFNALIPAFGREWY